MKDSFYELEKRLMDSCSLVEFDDTYVNNNKMRGTIKEIVTCEGSSPVTFDQSTRKLIMEEKSVNCFSHGLISVIGRRQLMEDAVTIAVNGEIENYDFFAVYDGYGGFQVANKCKERFHLIMAEEVNGKMRTTIGGIGGAGLDYWEQVMVASFMKMDAEVMRRDNMEASDEMVNSVGSTAVVVMVGKEEVVVANCGDSRAVLCRGGVVVPLSSDHKPERPDERKRVESARGVIINCFGTNRIFGVLAISRSIGGDQRLKRCVISKPEVTVTGRNETDEFLIIASDGLWDVVSNEFACEVVRRCLNGQVMAEFSSRELKGTCSEVAAMLAELAKARGSNDDISVIVVQLNK